MKNWIFWYIVRLADKQSRDFQYSVQTRRDGKKYIWCRQNITGTLRHMRTNKFLNNLRFEKDGSYCLNVCSVFLATQDSSSSTPKFYTFPQGEYTLLSGDQFYLNCTAGGRYDILTGEWGDYIQKIAMVLNCEQH